MGIVLAAVEAIERLVLARLGDGPDVDVTALTIGADGTRSLATPDAGALHVIDRGEGRPVLLLHGHGANVGTFAPLATRLVEAGRRVVAFDFRGFGRSSAVPGTFAFDDLVGDAVFVLDALDLRETIVVGHSMGGGIALALAATQPGTDRGAGRWPRAAQQHCPGPGGQPAQPDAGQDARLGEGRAARGAPPPRHRARSSQLRQGPLPEPRRGGQEGRRREPGAPRRGFARRLLGTDLSDRLASVQVPVLLLTGSADRVIAASESQRLADLLPDARVEIYEGAGHMLPMERAGEVAARIVRFADEVSGDA